MPARRDNRCVRVVSLVPSVTETLLAWEVVPVACTRFCEQPGIRQVGGTKNPDVGAVVDLAPDLVVMDAEENRRADHRALVAAGVPVHATAVRSLRDVTVQLPQLAERVGVRWSPPSVPADGPAPVRRRVVVPIWRRPWMVLGTPTYGASLLRHLGFEVASPEGRGPYPEVTAEELRALGGPGPAAGGAGVDRSAVAGDDGRGATASGHVGEWQAGVGADGATRRGAVGGSATDRGAVVLAPSEPYPFGPRHTAELGTVGPVVFVDGKDLFWWGARTAGAVERLGRLLRRTTGVGPPRR